MQAALGAMQPNRDQIIADYQAQQAQQAEQERLAQIQAEKDKAIRDEQSRINRNQHYDQMVSDHRFYTQSESYSSGTKGYHFIKNFKANDGNYYAEYHANRGTNKRYYSISERKWYFDQDLDTYWSKLDCDNCHKEYIWAPFGFPNTCPHCGTVRQTRYQ